MTAGFYPVHELAGLFSEPYPQQPVHSKRRVPDPGVAVIPVALTADAFGQTASRGSHNCTGGLIGEELQCQCGALDHFAPAPSVGALREPASPKIDRVLEELHRFVLRQGEAAIGPAAISLSTNRVVCPSPRVTSAWTPFAWRSRGIEAVRHRLSSGE